MGVTSLSYNENSVSTRDWLRRGCTESKRVATVGGLTIHPHMSDPPQIFHNPLLKFINSLEWCTEFRKVPYLSPFVTKETTEEQSDGRDAQGKGKILGSFRSPRTPSVGASLCWQN